MNFNIYFRHLVSLEIIYFKIFETVAQKFAIQYKKSWYKFLSTLLNFFLNLLNGSKKPHFHVTLNNHSTKKTPNVPVILSEKLEPVISNSEGKKIR